jgi:hypothetical protein
MDDDADEEPDWQPHDGNDPDSSMDDDADEEPDWQPHDANDSDSSVDADSVRKLRAVD